MTDFSALENPVLRPAADAKAISTVQTALGFALPTVLHTLLSESDGWSDDTGLLFYGTAELAERNGAWEVATYAPSYVAVADDGGGRVALVMKDSSSSAVVVTDSGDMDPADFRALDSDAIAWVERGCPFNVPAAPGSGIPAHSLVDVLLVHPLPNGVKDLVVIRRELGVDRSIGELKQGMSQLPFVLLSRVPYGAFSKDLLKLGKLASVVEVKEAHD